MNALSTRCISTLCAVALCLGATAATAQMRTFEQSMARMHNKLPRAVFDGRTLSVTTHKQLMQVVGFLKRYKANLKQAIGAWNKLIKTGRTQARRKALVANQTYFKALAAAVTAKAKQIKAPAAAAPAPQKTISLAEVFTGPDVGQGRPFIVDSLGLEETSFRAWPSPGTKARPSRWSAKLKFWVHYDKIANGDVVLVEVRKGRKALGPPTACQPQKVFAPYQLAYFDCTAPGTRKWKTLFSTAGAHAIHLSYKNPVEGRQFKDFATLHVVVERLLHGASNRPVVSWGTNYDMRLPVSTLEEAVTNSARNEMGRTDVAMRAAFHKEIAGVVIRTWFKRKARVGRTSISCLYKGKRVADGRLIPGADFNNWSYVRKGSPKRKDAAWEQHAFDVGMLRIRPGPGGSKGSYATQPHWLNENPGEYKCVVLAGGSVLKELYFTVGADGEIVKPPCQLKSVNTLSTVTLLRSKDHQLADCAYDKRIGRKQGFEGRVRWARGCPPR